MSGGNSIGQIFRLTTFGESHGPASGAVIDGMPSGIPIDLDRIYKQMARRRPGQSDVSSTRNEKDLPQILSGIQSGFSLGTPIAFLIPNTDARPGDYKQTTVDESNHVFRPSHADLSYWQKYKVAPLPGGGRASARETAARVAAGAIAEELLRVVMPTYSCVAYVESVHTVEIPADYDVEGLTRDVVDSTPVRCPHKDTALLMINQIQTARESGDSVGGTICCRIVGMDAGLGEPVFDKLEADLAKAMLSLPACRGFEIGSGFSSAKMLGSQHNDLVEFDQKSKHFYTKSNNSGGIQGGISNGEEIFFRIAFKPTSTLALPQHSVTNKGEKVEIAAKDPSRHDPCVLPRAVPIVEAMAALTIADHYLRQSRNRR